MKIGIEAQRLFRAKKHGMDVVALESIKALSAQYPQTEFIVFVRPGPDSACLTEGKNLKIVEIAALSYADWEQIQLPRAVKKHEVDLLHCTSNTAPVYCPVPLVVTVHDIIYLEQTMSIMKTASIYQKFGYIYRRWNVPSIMSNARKIVTVSTFEQEQIQRHLPNLQTDLEVVHNGVSSRFFDFVPPWKRSEIRKKYALPNSFIFFLANTDPKKNTPNVLKAYGEYVASVERCVPLVVADISQERLDSLISELNLQDIEDKIVRLDYVDSKHMPIIYQQASLFLYPSLRESFGLPIIEAMAASTPVITSSCASMPEVAGDAALLVDPTCTASISQMIRLGLSDTRLRETLQKRGRVRAKEFSWNQTAKNLDGVYREVLSSSNSWMRAA